MASTLQNRVPRASDDVAAPGPAAPGATERRLKLIIESAPCGLMVLDPLGRILAANRAALALLGLHGPADAVGKNIGTLVGERAREPFMAFVRDVSAGATQSIDYTVELPDRTRTLEARAVPLVRTDGPAVVLATTWDVTEQRSVAAASAELRASHAALEAERNTLTQALDAARRAADVAAAAERDARLVVAAEAERHRLEMDVLAERARQREDELRSEVASHCAAMAALRQEQERLTQTVQELNRSYAALVSERAEDRVTFTAALQDERARSSEMLNERELWRTTLGELVRGLKETSDRAQDLFDRGRHIRLVTGSAADAPDDQPPAQGVGTADPDQESSWQF